MRTHPALAAHADVLKMAKTREKRERIKWFNARQLFFAWFYDTTTALGLELARECEHEDARFLVSLFPAGAPTKEKAMAVFLSRRQDARCVCWAAYCGAPDADELMKQAAIAGNAWAQAFLGAENAACAEGAAWLEKSVAQGENEGMDVLSEYLRDGECCGKDEARARSLMLEGALLGDPFAQVVWAECYCEPGSTECFVWLRRAVRNWGGARFVMRSVGSRIPEQLQLYDGGGSGRIVFELGLAFSSDRTNLSKLDDVDAAKRAVAIYGQWSKMAKTAVSCWLWAAKHMGVVKDIRVMIAEVVWEERAAWSERVRV